eukprot:g42645.t1
MAERCGFEVMGDCQRCPVSGPAPAVGDQSFTEFSSCFSASHPLKQAVTLSAQYGINVFVLGMVLMLAGTFQRAGVTQEHILAYLSTLMAMQLVWMLWYFFRRHGKRVLVTEKDEHAGPRWLTGGLTLFAILSLVLDMFKFGYYIGYSSCLTATKGIYPAIHAVHTLSQVTVPYQHLY